MLMTFIVMVGFYFLSQIHIASLLVTLNENIVSRALVLERTLPSVL